MAVSNNLESALERLARTIPWTTTAAVATGRRTLKVHSNVARGMEQVCLHPVGWQAALTFDIDAHDGGSRWMDAEVAIPNIIVRRRSNGHAHYIYALRSWVPTTCATMSESRQARFANGIDRAYTRSLGADPSYSGHLVRSPWWAKFRPDEFDVMELRAEPYTLYELASYVREREMPNAGAIPMSRIGRNVTTFDRLRRWAYDNVAEYASAGRAEWEKVVSDRASRIADDVRGEEELAPAITHAFNASEVRAIARSVAKWVWEKYIVAMPAALLHARRMLMATQQRLRAERKRRAGGSMTREEYTRAAVERRQRAATMRTSGTSVRDIARALQVCIREVYRLLAGRGKATQEAIVSEIVQGASRLQYIEPAALPRGPSRGNQCEPLCHHRFQPFLSIPGKGVRGKGVFGERVPPRGVRRRHRVVPERRWVGARTTDTASVGATWGETADAPGRVLNRMSPPTGYRERALESNVIDARFQARASGSDPAFEVAIVADFATYDAGLLGRVFGGKPSLFRLRVRAMRGENEVGGVSFLSDDRPEHLAIENGYGMLGVDDLGHRRRGIARAMVSQAVDFLRSRYLHVVPSREYLRDGLAFWGEMLREGVLIDRPEYSERLVSLDGYRLDADYEARRPMIEHDLT